jgi:hypothetical protein
MACQRPPGTLEPRPNYEDGYREQIVGTHDPRVLRAALERDQCEVLLFPLGPFVDERRARS